MWEKQVTELTFTKMLLGWSTNSSLKNRSGRKAAMEDCLTRARGGVSFIFTPLANQAVPINRNLKLAGSSGIDSMHLINK